MRRRAGGEALPPALVGFLNLYVFQFTGSKNETFPPQISHAVMEMLIGLFYGDIALKKKKKSKN